MPSTSPTRAAAGPVTPARRPVFHAAAPVLPGESMDEFNRHVEVYTREFMPSTPTEFRLVYTLADAEWRLDRALRDEEIMVVNEIAQVGALDEFAGFNRDVIHAEATRRLIEESKAYPALQRYIAGFRMQYQRALKTLLDLRRQRERDRKTNVDECEARLLANPWDDKIRDLMRTHQAEHAARKRESSPASPPAALAPHCEDGTTETRDAERPAPPIPRSAPCPCGSGQKYKRCCGQHAPPVLNAAA